MCLSAAQWGGHGALPGMKRTDNDFRQVHFAANFFPLVLVSFLAENTFCSLRILTLLMSIKNTVVKTPHMSLCLPSEIKDVVSPHS